MIVYAASAVALMIAPSHPASAQMMAQGASAPVGDQTPVPQLGTTSSPTAKAETDEQSAEIIVTASKRETSLQKTPIAIDVVGGDTAKSVGLVNLAAIGTLAPSVNFGQANGPFTTVTIRGVSSQDTTELGDPAVAINVDGEYLNRPMNLASSLFDLQRVEILRGPQGTLYGRNATAGAINILTNRPTDTFSASMTASLGNYGQKGVEGYVNLPITEGIALRLAGIVDHHDGYTKSIVGPDLEDGTIKGVRAKLLLEPTDRLSLLVTGEYIENKSAGTAVISSVISVPRGVVASNVIAPPPSRDTVPGGIRGPYQNNSQRAIKGELTYDFGLATFTNVLAYRSTKADYFIDQFGLPDFLVDFESHSSYRTLANEARLTSGSGMPFNWQIGYYHFNENQGPAYIPIYQSASVYLTRAYETPRTIFNFIDTNAKSDAFFGEATVPIVGGLSVTGGVRYTSDSKLRVGNQQLLNVALLNSSAGKTIAYTTVGANGSTKSTRWTYNGGLNWQIDPSHLIYGKYTTGYKAGGFTTVTEYKPEDISSYEVGTKNKFANGTLTANAAAFLYDYKNQQVQTFIIVNGLSSATVSNAATSRIYGIEFEGIANITPDDRFRVTADYLHSRYNTFAAAVLAGGGVNVSADLSGNRSAFAPGWTIGASYSHTERGDWGSLTALIGTVYKSEYYTSSVNYRATRQTGFTKTDFTLTYLDPRDRFNVTAFIRNLENVRTLRYADFSSTLGRDLFRYQFSAPRTIGARLTVNFR